MKYIQLFILLFIILLSCTDSKSFEIDGTVENNLLDGKYIYLQQMEGNKLITFDSALVKNTKFKFKGHIIEPQFSEINYGQNDTLNFSPAIFVLHEGKMEAYIDSFSYVRGGIVNNNLAEYYAQSYYYDQKLNYLKYQLNHDDNLNDSLLVAFRDWEQLYEREKISYALQFIEMNNNNLGGVLVFLQNISYFSREEIRNILFYSGPIFRDNKDIKILEEYLEKTDTINVVPVQK